MWYSDERKIGCLFHRHLQNEPKTASDSLYLAKNKKFLKSGLQRPTHHYLILPSVHSLQELIPAFLFPKTLMALSNYVSEKENIHSSLCSLKLLLLVIISLLNCHIVLWYFIYYYLFLLIISNSKTRAMFCNSFYLSKWDGMWQAQIPTWWNQAAKPQLCKVNNRKSKLVFIDWTFHKD